MLPWSLYTVNPGTNSQVLVATDPRFTSYQAWLSSDYMLQALSYDPATTQKRLGDGFYEQQLIREQVGQLTGQRFLQGYASDEAEFRALMDNGITVARQWNLRPGVALTPAQVAQLTTDIVWLVSQTVTLPDGTAQEVLVPQVYARPRPGDLDGSGTLLAGSEVRIDAGGDFMNTGTVAGRTLVDLSAANVTNLGGRIAGNSVSLQAENDLANIGGRIEATDNLLLQAGRDITVTTTTTSGSGQVGGGSFSRTQVDRLAGLYVTGGQGLLGVLAGRDLTLTGAEVKNTGDTTLLQAGRDLALGTVATSHRADVSYGSFGYANFGQRAEVGTAIEGVGSVALAAGNDLTARAAAIAGGPRAVTLTAGRDLTLTAGERQTSYDAVANSKKKGFFSTRSRTTRDTFDQTAALGSTVSGDTVTLAAGQDLAIAGSQARAAGDLSLTAGRDVNILAARTRSMESHFVSEKKSGFSASFSTGISYGRSSLEQTLDGQGQGVATSSLTGLNVDLLAGRDATVQAATVIADRDVNLLAGRNVALTTATQRSDSVMSSKSSSTSFGLMPLGPRATLYGKTAGSSDGTELGTAEVTSLISANAGSIHIAAGRGNVLARGADLIAAGKITVAGNAIDLQAASERSESAFQSRTKSVTVGAQLTGLVGSKITAIADAVETARHTDNDRLAAAATLKAGYDAYKLIDGNLAEKVAKSFEGEPNRGDPNGAAIGIQATIGTSKTQTKSESFQETQRGANLQAKDIALTAREGDLTATGAKVQAETIALEAAGNLTLTAARNAQRQQSSQSGSSAQVGVTVGFGQQNGISFQIGASNSRARANGSETLWDNTLITAGNLLSLKSGADTTLSGAQLGGKTVKADIGGNLLIETRQDQSDFTMSQSSGGFGISLCIPPLCVGTPVTGSINLAKMKFEHSYVSAVGQSGIAAGSGGFDIAVKGHTDLKGGAITSAAPAEQNRLSTASLTFSDLTNQQKTQSQSSSVGFAYGGGSALSTLASNAVANGMANLAGPGGLPRNGSETSRTQSVISPAAVTITSSDARSQEAAATLTARDAATANQSLKNTLTLQDTAKLQQGMRKAQENALAGQMVGAVMTNAIGDYAQSQTKQGQPGWEDGSLNKILLHGLAGVVQAGVAGGNLAAGAAAGVANEILTAQMADYLKSQGIEPLVRDQQGKWVKNVEFDELMKAGSSLVGAAAGALVGGNGQSAQLGAGIAKTATENNYLKHQEAQRLAQLKEQQLKGSCGSDCQSEIQALQAIDKQRDQALAACAGVVSADCTTVRQDIRNAAAEYVRESVISLDSAYRNAANKTQALARGTLEGVTAGQIAGFGKAVAEGAVTMAGAAVTGLKALILQDPQAQAQAKQAAGATWDYVKNPDNWPELLGAMSPADREKLAQAYERGDGKAVGELLGRQVANTPISGGGFGTVKKVSTVAGTAEKVASVGANTAAVLDRAVIDGIQTIEKGLRPDPATYLSRDYINAHLAQFKGEVTKFSAEAPSGVVGPPGGTFVMPKSIADDLIAQSAGDVAKLERLLSLEPGTLGKAPVRIDVSSPTDLRMPSGNERGANPQWKPGGFTGGGIPEATINPAQPGTYNVNPIF